MLIAEPAVLVPARFGSVLAQLLERAGRADGGLPAELLRLQQEFRQAGAAWQRTVLQPMAPSEAGSAELPLPPAAASLSVVEVASLLECSDRNVRDLATRGSLLGRRSGGRWTFDAHEVASYLESRRAS